MRDLNVYQIEELYEDEIFQFLHIEKTVHPSGTEKVTLPDTLLSPPLYCSQPNNFYCVRCNCQLYFSIFN